LADHPLNETAEIEITCAHCGYRLMRTVAQLRRKTSIDCAVCGKFIATDGHLPSGKRG
jgi:ribosomal protein S27E